MPRPIRILMRGLGAGNRGGSQLLSYLLFESGYTRELIALGFNDAMARQKDLLAFMEGQPVETEAGVYGWVDMGDEYSHRLPTLKIPESP